MALADMQGELRGSLPKLPYAYTKTLVNRAWRSIRLQQLWSFNLFESAWITPPPIIGVGGVTTTQGLNTIQFDPTAIAAINAWQLANTYTTPTQMQFRIAVGGIYSIIAYDPVAGGATLDRIFSDISVADLGFQMYQVYYPAPFQDFLTWISVRNPNMFLDLDLTTTRADIDAMDPQRTYYQWPSRAVPYATDTRGAGTPNASATLGFPMFEMWGQPVTPFTYQCYGVRQGLDLVNPNDTLPSAVAEETVMALARVYAYEWAEANKDMAPRNSGPDFKFLIGQASAEYKKLLVRDRRNDREFVDNYCSRSKRNYGYVSGLYNTLAGVASPYSPL